MITFPSDNYKYSVSLQAWKQGSDNYVYTACGTMLRVALELPQKTMCFVNVDCYASSLHDASIQLYTSPLGVVEIPLRSIIVREFNNINAATTPSIRLELSMRAADPNAVGSTYQDTLTINLLIAGGLPYSEMNAPRNKDGIAWAVAKGHDYILPPNVMYNKPDGNGIVVETNFGVWGSSGNLGLTWKKRDGGLLSPLQMIGDRVSELHTSPLYSGDNTSEIMVSDGTTTKAWQLQMLDSCTDAVCVRWRSQTGAIRQHYFPIVSWINEADEELSLTNVVNAYDVRKSVSYGYRCKVSGLTAYGLWYYNDLLLSSNVHAIVMPTFSIFNTEMESESTRVYVSGSGGEVPNGAGFYDFEFSIKGRRYGIY